MSFMKDANANASNKRDRDEDNDNDHASGVSGVEKPPLKLARSTFEEVLEGNPGSSASSTHLQQEASSPHSSTATSRAALFPVPVPCGAGHVPQNDDSTSTSMKVGIPSATGKASTACISGSMEALGEVCHNARTFLTTKISSSALSGHHEEEMDNEMLLRRKPLFVTNRSETDDILCISSGSDTSSSDTSGSICLLGGNSTSSTSSNADNNLQKQSSTKKDQNTTSIQQNTPTSAITSASACDILISAAESDILFRQASALAFITWIVLLTMIVACVPLDQFVYLEGAERDAAATAFYCLAVSMVIVVIIPLGLYYPPKQQNHRHPPRLSGILVAALTVMGISLVTNFLLAWCPTLVLIDPVTKARVFVFRWLEWTPLAGLMTFLEEAVDLPRDRQERKQPYRVAFLQSVSCSCGLLFPFCFGVWDWSFWMMVSLGTYFTIFPRILAKHERIQEFTKQQQEKYNATMTKTTEDDNDNEQDNNKMQQHHHNNNDWLESMSMAEKEYHDRLRFGYLLAMTCAFVWTLLVVLYMGNFAYTRFYSADHEPPFPGSVMIGDTFFDVLAKVFYMKFIADVHKLVYDPAARARRQLLELCCFVSVLWESASDVIVVSVKVGGKTTAMLSPSFCNLVAENNHNGHSQRSNSIAEEVDDDDMTHASSDASGNNSNNRALVLETDATTGEVIDAYFVDPKAIMTGNIHSFDRSTSSHIPPPSPLLIEQGRKLSQATREVVFGVQHADNMTTSSGWGGGGNNSITGSTSGENFVKCILQRGDDEDAPDIYCEISASKHAGESVIGVARDMTERHRRASAERKALEAMVRQKEAQSINRFTRHEVKNGLLSSIEMVEVLKRLLAQHQPQVAGSRSSAAEDSYARMVKELGQQLHRTLDTVLAETMARDVIYKEYHPRLEGCEIGELLKGSMEHGDSPNTYALQLVPECMPRLHIDPQLILYIHRNAVSNAIKYGMPNGTVLTRATYTAGEGTLRIDVVNQPGPGHAELLELSDEATEGVFTQGKRLHLHLLNKGKRNSNADTSSGDGAWIMQKCALALNGECTIQFDPYETTFSVIFPVEQASQNADELFHLPDNTYGVAVDDSQIQRKLMGRMLLNAGIDEKRTVVLGNEAEECQNLSSYLSNILVESPDAKILVLMDENLDYKDGNGKTLMLSGSKLVADALKTLPPGKERQVLALVRSANDSLSDVDLYRRRAHGFFPKVPMQKEKIRELLAPLWVSRFGKEEYIGSA